MRALLWVVVVVAGLWSGYWFVGARAVEQAATQWFDQTAAAQGMQSHTGGVRVAGFPNRFDLTVAAPQVYDPASGFGWQGGDLRLFAMTWKPWHLIALAPDTQVITTPWGEVSVTASDLRGSAVLVPGVDLALRRTGVEATDLAIVGPMGSISAAKASLASAEDSSRRNSHRIGVRVTDLTPDPRMAAALPDLPAQISELHLDATLLLSAALDRNAQKTRPGVTALILDAAKLDWGPLTVTATGTLATISGGFAEGRIDLRIENWRLLPAVLGQIGLVDPVLVPTMLRAMEIMSQKAGEAGPLDVPLTFKSGRASFGFLPIGPAPRLGQRQ